MQITNKLNLAHYYLHGHLKRHHIDLFGENSTLFVLYTTGHYSNAGLPLTARCGQAATTECSAIVHAGRFFQGRIAFRCGSMNETKR